MYFLDKKQSDDGFYWVIQLENGKEALRSKSFKTKRELLRNIDIVATALGFAKTVERWIGIRKQPEPGQTWRQIKKHRRTVRILEVGEKVTFDAPYRGGTVTQPLHVFLKVYESVN